MNKMHIFISVFFLFLALSSQSQNSGDILFLTTSESKLGAQDGSLVIKVQNVGIAPDENHPDFNFALTYIVDNATPEIIVNSNGIATFDHLKSGQYCVSIGTGTGCGATKCFKMCPEQLIDNLNVTDATSTTSGQIQIVPFAGDDIKWKLTNTNFMEMGSGNLIQNVPPKIEPYSLMLVNSLGCVETRQVMIKKCGAPPQAFVIKSTVSNSSQVCKNDGSIKIDVLGNRPAYTIDWSGPYNFKARTFTSATSPYSSQLDNLVAGKYFVTVTDFYCSSQTLGPISVESNSKSGIQLNEIVYTGPNCLRNIELEPSGGKGPYTFRWGDNSTYSYNLNLPYDSPYPVTVTDANGCEEVKMIINSGHPTGTLLTGAITSSCGAALGVVTITNIAGGKPPYAFKWSNGATTQDISGLTAGTYTVTVTDANSCTSEKSFDVSDLMTVNGTVTNVCEGPGIATESGSISVTSPEGIAPQTYSWSTGDVTSTPFLGNLKIGNYTVTVTDNRGCTGSHTFHITNLYIAVGVPASQSGEIGTISGCALAAYCSDPTPQIISDIAVFQYTPNDPYCPCYGGGTLKCTLDPTLTFDVPPLTNLDCDETLLNNPPGGTDPTCGSCYTYPFSSPYVSTDINPPFISSMHPPFCTANFTCLFSPDLIAGLPSGYYIQASTNQGLIWCFGTEPIHRDASSTLSIKEDFGITCYPNPSNGELLIDIENLDARTVEVEICDLLGQILFKDELLITPSRNTHNIHFPENIVNGAYEVRFLKDGRTIKSRLIMLFR